MPVLALVALLALLVAGCGDEGSDRHRSAASREEGAPSITVEDASGRTVSLARPASRVISLVPSATRTLAALGAAGRLVGRTRYDTADARVAALPSVGGGLHPSLETIVRLHPDLVIRFAAEADVRTPRRLDALEIPHFAVAPERLADVREMIRDLAALVGSEARGDSLVGRLDGRLDSVRAAVDTLPRVPTVYLLGGEPPRVAGPATFIHELLVLAGGENVFGGLPEGYPQVSHEAFHARSPAVILAPEDVRVPEVAGARIARVPARFLHDPGPELHRAAIAVARALHPDVFR